MSGEDPRRPYHIQALAIYMSRVPGKQTVPRAEVWALAGVCKETAKQLIEVAAIDAKYVVKGVDQEEAKKQLCQGANGDVWQQLRENLRDQGKLKAKKVKSHLPFTAIGEGHITLQDYVLNNLADAAAATAAEEAQFPTEVQAWHAQWQSRAFLVALRIATVEAWH